MKFLNVLLLFAFACTKAFAGIDAELDIVFRDSTLRCRYFYVLSPNTVGTNDTLAMFDTLSFNGQNRVSLFFTANSSEKNMLSMVDSSGLHIESNSFRISPHRTTFAVFVDRQQIKIASKDYLYPLKNKDERSYFIFLLFFFVVKIVITTIFVFSSKMHKRLISIASGAFLISSFIDWFLPVHYLYCFFATALAEYLLIAVVGHKSISWFRTAMLVLTVNITGFGMIAALYLGFVFW